MMHHKRGNLSQHTASPILSTVKQTLSVPFDEWLASGLPYSAPSMEDPAMESTPRSHQELKQLSTKSYDPAAYCAENAIYSPINRHDSSDSPIFPSLGPSNVYSSSHLSSSPYSETYTSPVDFQTDPTSVGMSRAPSGASTSFYKGMENMRLGSPYMSRGASNVGQSFGNSFNNDLNNTVIPEPNASIAPLDPRQVLSHMGGAADDKKLVEAFNQSNFTGIDEESGAVKMERTSSAQSNNSATSRITRRTREQAASSNRALAPATKPTPSPAASITVHHLLPVSQNMSRIQSSESQNGRIAIPKASTQYPRSISEKIKCDKCNNRPEGYRGEHELQRHQIRAHEPKRKAYICKEAEEDGNFLSECVQCNNFKQYNAYYNAAAHLRRRHFNAKPKGEKRKGKLKEEEKRGGKGGGRFPTMDVLKGWMYEIEIFADGEPVNEVDQIYSPSRRMELLQALQYAPDFETVGLDSSARPCENPLNDGLGPSSDSVPMQLPSDAMPSAHDQVSSPPFDTAATSTLPPPAVYSDNPLHEDASRVSSLEDPDLFNMQLYEQYPDLSFDDLFASSQP